MTQHKWTPILLAQIAEEYGEPEQPGEHNTKAAERVLDYLERVLDYNDANVPLKLMYELYLYEKYAASGPLGR